MIKKNILSNTNEVIPTDTSKKITFDGITKSYQVYKVKIDNLYYNDKNDRIVTYISKYKNDNNIEEFSLNDKENYNKIIEKFIIESNEQAYKKTKNNIKLFGQIEPAVVLTDGRVIDGNRRFTCLRDLSKSNDEFKYIETVVLDRNIEDYRKEIKLLELQLQHGREERIEYNPINKLVGLYNDVIDSQLITEDEYIRSTNESPSKVKKDIKKAILMAEFLEFINCDKQFHIARDLALDGPLSEISNVLNKVKDDDARNDMKNIIFTSMAMKPKEDMSRYIRSFSQIVNSKYMNNFIEENTEHAEEFLEEIDQHENITTDTIRNEIRNDEELLEKLMDSYDKYDSRTKINKSLNAPKKQIEKAIEAVENIDTKLLNKLETESLKEFIVRLDDLQESINRITNTLENK